MQIARFTEKLDYNYRYMLLPNGEADVFIYNFIEEEVNEEIVEYIYEFNEFRTSEITEEQIKENPLDYLNYSNEELSQEEKIKMLENRVEELENQIENIKKQ